MKFKNIKEIRGYLVENYPKGKVTMASWMVSDYALAIGIYEDEDLIKGVMVYMDILREQWILLDSLPADLAVRNYVEFRNEFDEAIELFETLESMEDEEDFFFSDLD